MFSTGTLHPTPTPPPPLEENRTIGAIVLFVCIVVCLLLVFSLDAAVINPYNAAQSVTATWRAAHPPTSTPPAPVEGDQVSIQGRQIE